MKEDQQEQVDAEILADAFHDGPYSPDELTFEYTDDEGGHSDFRSAHQDDEIIFDAEDVVKISPDEAIAGTRTEQSGSSGARRRTFARIVGSIAGITAAVGIGVLGYTQYETWNDDPEQRQALIEALGGGGGQPLDRSPGPLAAAPPESSAAAEPPQPLPIIPTTPDEPAGTTTLDDDSDAAASADSGMGDSVNSAKVAAAAEQGDISGEPQAAVAPPKDKQADPEITADSIRADETNHASPESQAEDPVAEVLDGSSESDSGGAAVAMNGAEPAQLENDRGARPESADSIQTLPDGLKTAPTVVVATIPPPVDLSAPLPNVDTETASLPRVPETTANDGAGGQLKAADLIGKMPQRPGKSTQTAPIIALTGEQAKIIPDDPFFKPVPKDAPKTQVKEQIRVITVVTPEQIGLELFEDNHILVRSKGTVMSFQVHDALPNGERIERIEVASMTLVTDRSVIRIRNSVRPAHAGGA